MKALSVRQPWANLIAIGLKTIETRTWKTNYRGPLAINASKYWDIENATLFKTLKGYMSCDPRGVIIATCSLIDIVKYSSLKEFKKDDHIHYVTLDCGWVSYGWRLTNIHKLKNPIPCRGLPGLFEVNI